MINFRTAQFLKQFPGPYSYSPGSDGVDATFDIFCLTTDRHIASTYYWEKRDPCELKSRVICSALNDHIMGEVGEAELRFSLSSPVDLRRFRQMHPGPYTGAKMFCDYRGPGWEVNCTTTGEAVICVFGRSFRDSTWLISWQLARVLNLLPG